MPDRRRSGPAGEARWWDADDQAVVEAIDVDRRRLGRGWVPVPMVNNEEHVDPLGGDDASAAIRAERAARGLRALDEGRAWRHRRDGALVVLRLEAFATADDGAHRRAWEEHGAASLDETWRQRWRDREAHPSWIEARRMPPDAWPEGVAGRRGVRARPVEEAVRRAVDWFRIEDHTDPLRQGSVAVYQHLVLWRGRGHATVTVRHDVGLDLGALPLMAAADVWRGLAPLA